MAKGSGGNSHQRKILESAVERIVKKHIPNAQEIMSERPIAPRPTEGKLRRFLTSNITWGGIGVIIGARGASLSQLVMGFISWAFLCCAFVEVRFFSHRKIIGNTISCAVLGLMIVALWRWTPAPQSMPSLDQMATTFVDKFSKRFPWMSAPPPQPSTPTVVVKSGGQRPNRHTHVTFDVSQDGAGYHNIQEGLIPELDVAFYDSGDWQVQKPSFGAGVATATATNPYDNSNLQDKLKTVLYRNAAPLNPHAPGGWISVDGDRLTSHDMQELANEKAGFCIYGSMRWSDETGRYETFIDQCLLASHKDDGSKYLQWRIGSHNNVEKKL
jgi:hypothetical protein